MENSPLRAEEGHCHGGTCCDTPSPAIEHPADASGSRARTFRIATMDCSAEESEIRRALDPLPGRRGLNFQLSARTLAIDADVDALPVALEATRPKFPESICEPGIARARMYVSATDDSVQGQTQFKVP